MQREQILAAACGSQRIVVALVHREADGRMHVDDATAVNVDPAVPVTASIASAGTAPWIDQLRRTFEEKRWNSSATRQAGLIVAPPTETVLLKTARTPDLPVEQRAAVLRFEVEQALPFAPDELAWVSACTGRTGDELEHAIAAVKRHDLIPLAAVASGRRRGGRIVPLALALATRRAPFAQDGTHLELAVLAETTATLLAARSNGRTLLRTILHPTLTSNDSAAFERAAVEIARAVTVVRRQLGAEALGDVELSGGVALVRELAPRLQEKLGVPPRLFAPAVDCSVPGDVAPAELAGVLALAECAFSGAAATCDLTPASKLADARSARARPLIFGLAAGLALGPLVWAGVLWRSTQATRSTARQISAEITPLRKLERQRHEQLAELRALEQKLAALDSSEAARSRWVELLAALEAQVTSEPALWLESLECVPEIGTTTAKLSTQSSEPIPERDVFRVRIHAVAKHDPAEPTAALRRARALLARLASTAPFSGVERVQFDDTDSALLRFEAELRVHGRSDR